MSRWTYVNGVIRVAAFRTNNEGLYAVNTVMENMPPVATGSEGECDWYVTVASKTYTCSSSHDQFNRRSNRIPDNRTYPYGMIDSSPILVTLDGSLRDRDFEDTYKEVVKFLFRLSKHLYVERCLISVKDDWDKEKFLTGNKLHEALIDNHVTEKRSIYSGGVERWGCYQPTTPWQDWEDREED